MSTNFTLDLNQNELRFGTVADGQIVDLNANIKLSSAQGAMPVSGVIEGSFIGDIKGDTAPPITIPHKKNNPAGFHIMVVGTGGTGGYLVRDLSRFIYALKEKGDSRQFSITLIDGDVVEQKNVLRQNFTPRDVGKHKAEVLARRHANAFGIEINCVNEMATYALLNGLHDSSYSSNVPIQNIVIGCVDNHEARRAIFQYSQSKNNVYWLDSGNEKKSGQVVLGYGRTNVNSYNRWYTPERNTTYNMPNVIDLYPEIADPKEDEVPVEKSSCAEAAMVETQTIQVNITAANVVFNFVSQILMEQPITINSVEFNTKNLTNVAHLTEGYLAKIYGGK